MKRIEDLLANYDLNKDAEKIINVLNDDSILYKIILKEIFLQKIKYKFGNWVEGTTEVKRVFERSKRKRIVHEFQKEINIQFPKLRLAEQRLNILVLTFIVPPLFIFVYIFLSYDLRFYPEGLLVVLICLVIMPVPALLIDFFIRDYFSPLDWRNVNTINDLLTDLSHCNYNDFANKNFKRTIQELKTLQTVLGLSRY